MVKAKRLTHTIFSEKGIALPTDGMALKKKAPEPLIDRASRKRRGPDTTKPHRAVSPEDLPRIDWELDHAAYRLTEEEIKLFEEMLPNREVRWLLPVPRGNSDEEINARRNLSGEQVMVLRGKPICVMKEQKPSASRTARIGNLLHIWAEPKTGFDIREEESETLKVKLPVAVSAGAQAGKQEGLKGIRWDQDYVVYPLDETERVLCSLMKERELLWIVPVPGGEQGSDIV
ncbi:hypothetical protein GF318_01575, partial [Candidatus Micrarchaeota archaeon]|nr:hypothetical protein [Candidatus Micrarchaeota archaeon]